MEKATDVRQSEQGMVVEQLVHEARAEVEGLHGFGDKPPYDAVTEIGDVNSEFIADTVRTQILSARSPRELTPENSMTLPAYNLPPVSTEATARRT